MNKSSLHLLRQVEVPKLPEILNDLNSLTFVGDNFDLEPLEIRAYFPHLDHKKVVRGVLGEKRNHIPMNVGVLFSGGQAAGGHNVVIGLFKALKTLNPESSLIGFLLGADGLIKNKHIELNQSVLDAYLNQGGFDLLGSARTKTETKEQFQSVAETVKHLNLNGLVIIGGDDSNTNAALIAEYFIQEKIETKVIGVPKTIDGDLKNECVPISFGFDTACKTYSNTIGSIARDAFSAKKYYYFIKLMGRSASHVTLECALETRPNMAIISEEVAEEKKTIHQVVGDITDLIVERAAYSKNYGIILIPEGLLEFIEDIQTDLLAPRDPHGNVEVSKIDTVGFLINLVDQELKKRTDYKGTFNPISIFCGYEGRSCLPSHFDSAYTFALGYTAALLLDANFTGYMAYVDHLTQNVEKWQIGGIPLINLMHLEKRNGKLKPVIKKALVDLSLKPFTVFKEQRKTWRLLDDYGCPGPIQFYGPKELTDKITKTLFLEHSS